MQPTQFASCATSMGNQPIVLTSLLHWNTSTGHTSMQNRQALQKFRSTVTLHLSEGGSCFFAFAGSNSGTVHPLYTRCRKRVKSRVPAPRAPQEARRGAEDRK